MRSKVSALVGLCLGGLVVVGCTPASPPPNPPPTSVTTSGSTTKAPRSTTAPVSTTRARRSTTVPPTSEETDPVTDPAVNNSTPESDPRATGTELSVPYGLYAFSSYDGSRNVSIASLRMKRDGSYSMMANGSGSGIVDPDHGGMTGEYEIVDAATVRFTSGPFADLTGRLTVNYRGQGRDFIDITQDDGTKQSYQFVNA